MESPLYAEAVLVKGEKIIAVGSTSELLAMAGGHCETIDLNGKTMMPAFIDAHGHFTAAANSLLQPDMGSATGTDEIVALLGQHIAENKIPNGKWVIAAGYDHNRIKSGPLPDRRSLDLAAPNNPVILQHQSGHNGILNSAALRELNITPQTPSPDGGKIEVKDGELTGFLEENAFISALSRAPTPDTAELLGAFEAVQHKYASYGITTVQDGMANNQMLQIYDLLCSDNRLTLDLVAYLDTENSAELLNRFKLNVRQYQNHFKIGGYKIFLDGSPQSRTAWMLEPYSDTEDDYVAYSTLSDGRVSAAIDRAISENMQLLAHCNGDAACRQFISLYRCAHNPTQNNIRPVIVHAQFITKSQLAEAAQLGMIPSFFLAHIYHWGESHIKHFGLQRASRISPAATAEHLKIPFTLHQDAPVINPDMLETVWCAVTRKTTDGRILGEDERISPLCALRAITINAARQYFEEDIKGSLRAGKLADFVILSDNPLTCGPDNIREIKVLETIKSGSSIYSAQ